jgi:hypothetical protein
MSSDFCVDVNELILLNQQNKLLLKPCNPATTSWPSTTLAACYFGEHNLRLNSEPSSGCFLCGDVEAEHMQNLLTQSAKAQRGCDCFAAARPSRSGPLE